MSFLPLPLPLLLLSETRPLVVVDVGGVLVVSVAVVGTVVALAFLVPYIYYSVRLFLSQLVVAVVVGLWDRLWALCVVVAEVY